MRPAKAIAVAAIAALTAWGVGASAQTTATRTNQLLGAKSWAYQLTNLGPEQQAKIAASPFDLVVVDYSRAQREGPEEALTPDEVSRMQKKPDGSRRLLIAYLSIGESEDYRYYWKPEWFKAKPAWNGKESKEWKGNYLVQYWNPDWQRIIFGNPESYVDRILAGGFDGFYIDRADAYYRFGDTKEARDRMATFVLNVCRYIRSKKPDAAVLIQNAEELLDRRDYVDCIDGVAKEDLLFGITHREEWNKKGDIDYSTNMLVKFKQAGKAIFVVEYLARANFIEAAKKRMTELGFVLYYGPRGLFELAAEAPVAGPRRGPLDPTPDAPSLKKKTSAKKSTKTK